jgi:hypothetical protein
MGRKTKKYYSFNGLAGCVIQKTARRTKTLVGLYEGNQSGIGEDMLWFTVCEKHHSCVGHYSMYSAQMSMSKPDDWCEVCSKELEK